MMHFNFSALKLPQAMVRLLSMKRFNTYLIACTVALSLMPAVSPAFSQDNADADKQEAIRRIAPENAEIRYSECLDFAVSAPDRGIGLALAWQSEGGGVPARHCEAVGLFHLKEYKESAVRLDKIAEDARRGADMPLRGFERIVASSALAAGIYTQSANAWLLAGSYSEASQAIESALALVPKESGQWLEILIDRARISAADDDYELAFEDLQTVLVYEPFRVDVLLLAASAGRLIAQPGKAAQLLERALEKSPNNPDVLIERGLLYQSLKQPDLARSDWLRVARDHPETIVGERARAALEAMEVAGIKE